MQELLEQLASLAQAAESMSGTTPDEADSAEQTAESYIQRTADALNAYSVSLSDLTDLSGVDSALVGQYLTYDGSVWSPSTLSLALSDLSDVSSTAPTTGQLLAWNATNASWVPQTVAGGVTTLSDLSDTAVASPSSGDSIEWNGTSWAKIANNITLGDLSTYLSDSDIASMVTYGDSASVLSDIQISTPSSGQLLVWNSTNSQFENQTVATGTGATVLNDLNDVTVSAPASGDMLVYNNTLTVFENTTAVADHLASTANPHSVTKTQVGLSNVTNVKQVEVATSAFTKDFTSTGSPPTTSFVLLEAIAGSMRYAALANLPISTPTQTALDAKSIGQHTRIFYIEDPTATDSFPIGAFPVACTITRVSFITDVGTVDFNLEERVEATPFTAGTNVFTVDDQASTTNSIVTSFANAGMAANAWLWYAASAVASSPTKLIIKITYTED